MTRGARTAPMRRVIRGAIVATLGIGTLTACGRAPATDGDAGDRPAPTVAEAAQFWNSATIYFLLVDRFANGDPSNDTAQGRAQDGAVVRSFLGGDLAGLRRTLEEGYFDSLGVTAIWMTPFVEQIRGGVDEGTGWTYGYHGYWTRDWTTVEPALGTEEDLRAVVDAAHRRGIRVLMDAVINHTGPVTPLDPQWPDAWVRTGPKCGYDVYRTTVPCTLVDNLPDIRTESDEPVELPPPLVEKWRREGRLDGESAELDAFFARTGYPRAPRYYVMKWLTDWVREFGFDGYRMDTARNFEESVAKELRAEADRAFADWKAAHPGQVLDDLPFYVVGEAYGYSLGHGRDFPFGDRTVDYYAHGYDALINFAFKEDARGSLDDLFTRYADALRDGALRGVAVLNYVSSHDDSSPYDPERTDPLGAGTSLLLAPGGAQIYYGDELARPLEVAGARGDANLRSFMNWDDLAPGSPTASILEHWRKLGRFRQAHPAVGAGAHHRLQAHPYIFARTLDAGGVTDRVLVALDQPAGTKTIPVFDVFADGATLVDAYSGVTGVATDGAITLMTDFELVLLSEQR